MSPPSASYEYLRRILYRDALMTTHCGRILAAGSPEVSAAPFGLAGNSVFKQIRS
jgi:hypothetical protein